MSSVIMDVFRSFVVILFLIQTISDVTSACRASPKVLGASHRTQTTSESTESYLDCNLSINKDFGNPSPVFLQNSNYLTPSEGGAISFKRSETVSISCPGNKKHIVLGNSSTSYASLEAHCIINSTFRVDRWIGEFKDIRCNSQPWFTTEDTKVRCHKNSRIHRVGYKIKGVFHSLYEACFDKSLIHTYYVKHSLTPTSRYMQTGLARPQFIEGSLFGKLRMSALYKIEHQKAQLDAILGNNMGDRYITNKQSLTRGHLAARADFTLGAETRATFHYVNTSPQWKRGNAGDWAALEEALRRRVQQLGVTVTVYTGTHGVMTLPDSGGQQREVHLTVDENNNPVVPVPMYFYKLVYDPKNQKAVAFLTINSSFYNKTMVNDLVFCEDVCEGNSKFSWLKWRSNDGTHSFCCDYEEFSTAIDYLPIIETEGMFY